MACFLKPPSGKIKGVVTFTTPEQRNLINCFPEIQSGLKRLKERFVIGLHHNWHNHQFISDPLYDFHLAGVGNLREVNNAHFNLIPLDACNFVPSCFTKGNNPEKFWDLLFIGRAVEFKGYNILFQAVRKLYDSGHKLRVLFICPVPPPSDGSITNIRDEYEKLFSSEDEQDLFTLMTMDYRYPFPFDLPTLAHFYRSSRVFVHPSPDEWRCRVASYAWGSEIPVVGSSPVGSLIAEEHRKEPYFFEVKDPNNFPEKILEALKSSYHVHDFSPLHSYLMTEKSIILLNAKLQDLFIHLGLKEPCSLTACKNLDIRFGRHHGLATNKNRIDQYLGDFINILNRESDENLQQLSQCDDPENVLAKLYPTSQRKAEKTTKTAGKSRLSNRFFSVLRQGSEKATHVLRKSLKFNRKSKIGEGCV